jgi:ribosome-associated protein
MSETKTRTPSKPQAPSQVSLSRGGKDATHDPERAAVRAKHRTSDSEETAQVAAQAALEKKGEDVVIIDLRELSSYTDFLVICSGSSDRQLEAVAESVSVTLKAAGHVPVGSEGTRGGKWALLDFGDIVVHVFHQDERGYYDLEGLWADAPRVDVKAPPAKAAPVPDDEE